MFTARTIGLITRNFESLYHTPLIHTIHTHLRERDYRLISISGTPQEIAATRLAFDRVDGWLVLNTTEGIEDLRDSGKPLVVVNGDAPGVACVVPDNHGGTTAAIDHLVAQGRTRIACITYAINPDFKERYAAYKTALAAHKIAFDPALVLDTQSYMVHDVYQAVRSMIASGKRFDGAFCANDWLAFGTMQAVQEAGWRIPDDVAVVGFDDSAEAKLATPPLTSVRQDLIEPGRVATNLLLDQIEHGQVPPKRTTGPTQLIIRESSAARQGVMESKPDTTGYGGADWAGKLAHDLVQRIFRVQLDQSTSPEQIWPGVTALVEALAAVVEGREPGNLPPDVWNHVFDQAHSGEAVMPIVELLRTAGLERLADADREGAGRLMRWLLVCQYEMMHQQLVANSNQAERDRQAFMRENTLLNHFESSGASPRLLEWMDQSNADWAVLGLWADGQATSKRSLIDITSTYIRGTGAMPCAIQTTPEQFPPIDLLSAPVRDSLEYLIKLTPLAQSDRRWGYLAYAERFFWTFNDLASNRSTYITTALEREELLESLNERQATLQLAFDREQYLANTIRELGCPIIPLLKGVLLIPLIGAIDDARAALIIERMLEGVGHARAERVLLDITGVPLVDTQVAAAFIQMTRAVGLLGAKVTLVGVRPEIAQSIVGLGLDLSMLETKPTLASALQSLIKR